MPTQSDIHSFLASSGLTDDYILEMGCYPVTTAEVAKASGFPVDKLDPDGAIAIPYPGVCATDGSAHRRYRQQGQPKYLGQMGQPPEIYVPVHYAGYRLQDTLVVVEGEKKAGLLDNLGIRAVGIPGVSAWAADSERSADRGEGVGLSADTLPHATLSREALAAKQVIIVGDSDLAFNAAGAFCLRQLKRSLSKYIAERQSCLSAEPDWCPITNTRNVPVSLVLCPPRWSVMPNLNADKSPIGFKYEAVKTGLDDLFLWMLAEQERTSSAQQERAFDDPHKLDRQKTTHRLLRLLHGLALSDLGADDAALGLLVGSLNQRDLAYRSQAWTQYDRGMGIWVTANASEEYAAPLPAADLYADAAALQHEVMQNTMAAFAGIPEKELPSEVADWQTATKKSASGLLAASSKLRSTREQGDVLKQTKRMVTIGPEKWDAQNHLLACRNGVLDLRSGELMAHAPEHLITMRSETLYDPLAECPQWDAFLEQVQPDPAVRKYLQTIMGYASTGDVSAEQMYFYKGTGANGKGVFIRAIRGVLGSYAVVASKTLIIKQHNSSPHPTNLAALAGKRWATLSELADSGALDTAVLKGLTGEDKQTARKMNKDFGDFDLKATITCDTNDIPYISDSSPAMRRRLIVIDWAFDATGITDEGLGHRLKREASGILNWLIAGARNFYAGGLRKAQIPEAVLNSTAELWANIDVSAQWIESDCVKDASVKIDGRILCAAYSEWCKENRVPEIGRHSFFGKLRLAGFKSKKSNGRTLFFGLRLKNEVEKQTYEYTEEAPIPRKPPVTEISSYNGVVPLSVAAEPARKFRRVQ
jgi:P4 family phage/plasmid primase-like protien